MKSTYYAQAVETLAAETKLTKRETDVVRVLVTSAPRTEEMAKTLGLTAHTVNNHLKSVFEKIGSPGKLEILQAVMRTHWRLQYETAAAAAGDELAAVLDPARPGAGLPESKVDPELVAYLEPTEQTA